MTSRTLRWRTVRVPSSWSRSGSSWTTASVALLSLMLRLLLGALSVGPDWLPDMTSAYGVRAGVSNICSRRVLKSSNIRARNRTDVLSNVLSTQEDLMSAVAYDDTAAGYAVPLPTRRPQRPRLVL